METHHLAVKFVTERQREERRFAKPETSTELRIDSDSQTSVLTKSRGQS